MWSQWWTGRDRSLRLTAFGEFKASKSLKNKKGGDGRQDSSVKKGEGVSKIAG